MRGRTTPQHAALPATPTVGRPIEVVNVRVDKQRGPIGVILESSPRNFPTVTRLTEGETTPYDLQVGDTIAAINGRPSCGAKIVARTIIRSKHTDLEVWRPVRWNSIYRVQEVQGVAAPDRMAAE